MNKTIKNIIGIIMIIFIGLSGLKSLVKEFKCGGIFNNSANPHRCKPTR